MAEDKIIEPETGTFKIGISLAQISVIIIVLSVLKEILYYKNFNVPIHYFLSLSGLGLVISEDLLIIIPFLVLHAILLIFSYNLGKKERLIAIEKDKEIQATNEVQPDNVIQPTNELKLDKFRARLRVVMQVCVVLVFISFFIQFFQSNNSYIQKLGIISNIILLTPVVIMVFYIFDYHKYITIVIKVLLFMVLIFALLQKLKGDLSSVVKGKYKGTIIQTSDSTYISTDSCYFIGKTEKYVFIYSIQDSTTTIIPSDQVTKMILKSK